MGLTSELPIDQLFAAQLTDDQVRDMWYDWFCKDTSLVNKGRRLLKRLEGITPSPRFDAANTYAFFKNNCPCDGKLYDDFRICDKATGDVLFCVVPAEGYTRTQGEATVRGKDPDTDEFGELIRGQWSDVKAFFKEQDKSKVMEMIFITRWNNLHREAEWANKEFDRQLQHAKWQAEYEASQAAYAAGREDREYADCLTAMLAR